MDAVLLLLWPKCGADLPSLRHQSADILSLEAALRPPRSEHAGRALASPAERAPAHLDAGAGRARVVPAQAISALGQRQAGGAAPAREAQRFDLHGGTHPGPSEAARGAARTAEARSAAAGPAEVAQRFLEVLLDRVPFAVKALQVDGGSEFAAEFEEACQQKQLPLFVLPPKSPKLNAHVERSHRTHHEEFYQVSADSDHLPVLNDQLRRWEHTYNCVRPHQSLAYLTPLEFITRWKHNPRKAK